MNRKTTRIRRYWGRSTILLWVLRGWLGEESSNQNSRDRLSREQQNLSRSCVFEPIRGQIHSQGTRYSKVVVMTMQNFNTVAKFPGVSLWRLLTKIHGQTTKIRVNTHIEAQPCATISSISQVVALWDILSSISCTILSGLTFTVEIFGIRPYPLHRARILFRILEESKICVSPLRLVTSIVIFFVLGNS